MPLNFIDVSHWNGNVNFAKLPIDGAICKATQGISFKDPKFDSYTKQLNDENMLSGFYHFADRYDPIKECQFFLDKTISQHGIGIPVLDWEGVYNEKGELIFEQPVSWINNFVRYYHDQTGVWPWIYANPWRFNQGGVEQNCGRWVAKYPNVLHPDFNTPLGSIPKCDGLVCAWQFASDGRISGYNGNLDLDKFYGTREAWKLYAKPNASGSIETPTPGNSTSVLENDEYKIIVEKKS